GTPSISARVSSGSNARRAGTPRKSPAEESARNRRATAAESSWSSAHSDCALADRSGSGSSTTASRIGSIRGHRRVRGRLIACTPVSEDHAKTARAGSLLHQNEEERLRLPPVTLDGAGARPERFGRFLHRKPGEKEHLHDLDQPRA